MGAKFGWAVAVLAAAAALFASPARAAPPIAVYGQDPDISDVQISDNGRKLATLRTINGEPQLYVVDLDTRKANAYALGDMKVRNIAWSGPNHVLVYVSKTTNMFAYRASQVEFCGVFSIDIRGAAKPKQLLVKMRNLALQTNLCGVESRLWTDNGDVLMRAAVSRSGELQGEDALFLVNGDTGSGKLVARGTETTSYWVTSPKGYAIARIEHAQKSNRYRVMTPTDADRLGGWKTVFSEDTEIPSLKVYGAKADETALIIGTRQKSGLYALFEMSLADGKIGQPMFEPPGVDIDDVITDPYTGAVVGASYVHNRPEQIYFQNDLQGALTAVQKSLSGWGAVSLVNWDRARQKFVVYAEGGEGAGTYFLLDRAAHKLDFLSAKREALKKEDIGAVKAFSYPARDKITIPAFLTLPPSTPPDAKNLPLVVFPHGGPAMRDAVQYDYWAQAMASRGYAVLQMNFRGSGGYGGLFQALGDGEWGGKMQDDVTDGVKFVIEKGIADPARICIVGGSYGGYATLAGAAFTPELYKCAVSVAGVSDLDKFMAYEGRRFGADSSIYEYWAETIGGEEKDKALYASRSPARAADKITADVLLIHGRDDTVVPIAQSEIMYDALKDAGKPVEFVKLDGEDHWLSRAPTRTAMLNALEGFLAKHLGGKSAGQGN